MKEDENGSCHDCFFNKKCTLPVIKIVGECAANCREDNKGVVFVEVQEQTQETEKIKERKVGDVFEYQGKKLKVVETADNLCFGCYFFDDVNCQRTEREGGECSNLERADYKPVIFVEVYEHPQELNLCEILKDCPKGTKFYSTVFGDVRFKEIVDAVYPIVVSCKDKHAECFSADGKVMIKYDGECCIFPSKEMRDWSKFTSPWYKKEESIKPKFKVGDRIRHKETNKNDVYEISKVYDDSYGIVGFNWGIYMKYQDQYELVSNKFDPKTLNAFDRVIVYGKDEGWFCTIFSHIGEGEYPYNTASGNYAWCVPYNDDTKHLVGTKEEAPDFYKYWED